MMISFALCDGVIVLVKINVPIIQTMINIKNIVPITRGVFSYPLHSKYTSLSKAKIAINRPAMLINSIHFVPPVSVVNSKINSVF